MHWRGRILTATDRTSQRVSHYVLEMWETREEPLKKHLRNPDHGKVSHCTLIKRSQPMRVWKRTKRVVQRPTHLTGSWWWLFCTSMAAPLVQTTFLTHAHQPRTPTVSQLQLLNCFILVLLRNLGIATRRFEVGILRTSPLLLGLWNLNFVRIPQHTIN